MKSHVRAAVAYIVGRIISDSDSSHVYDHSQSRYITISGDVSEDSVSVYDHENGAHITGDRGSLYHHGEAFHVSLDISGNNFRGYDFGSASHFSGSVSGAAITFYDYEHSQYFNYSI